jgi:small subunit ribosomal protein S6
VIKFITVRIDEEQKRLSKIKAIRESRAKAKPAPAPEAAEAGSAAAPATA